ncbi:hypothetical protein [Pseudozobellia sp. WGM2]|uniref:hypothetical protein n=1 Tax=Pseudozobellia sp. WGM2 TaxID=2787625 RepID=UPI001AE0C686|nr:hypothetical protein [Pseudozobellia sp. WGM2]
MSDFKEKQNKRIKQSKILFLIGILLVVLIPIIITQFSFLFDFTNTGQIGDTIGGITAPITNLIGAILVYYAFLVQLDANKLIFQQIQEEKAEQKISKNREYVFEIFKFLKEEFYSFTITSDKRIGSGDQSKYVLVEYRGVEAMEKMFHKLMKSHDKNDWRRDNIKLLEFLNIISLFKNFLTKLNEVEIAQIDKKFFLENVEYIYTSKIKVSIDKMIQPCEKCGEFHGGNPERIIEINDEIHELIEKIKKNYA